MIEKIKQNCLNLQAVGQSLAMDPDLSLNALFFLERKLMDSLIKQWSVPFFEWCQEFGWKKEDFILEHSIISLPWMVVGTVVSQLLYGMAPSLLGGFICEMHAQAFLAVAYDTEMDNRENKREVLIYFASFLVASIALTLLLKMPVVANGISYGILLCIREFSTEVVEDA